MPSVEFIIKLRDKYSKGMGKAAKATDKFNKSTQSANKASAGLGSKLTGLISIAAVGAVFLKTAKDVAQYETNIASLSAITGASGDQLEGFKSKIGEVAKNTKASSVNIAKAFELVGSAKPELLKSADALGTVTEKAIILAQASGETLESSVQSLTGTLNQFNLGAEDANKIIDILAAGAKEGAAAVPLITQSLDKFGTVAASMNIDVAESVGLIETLAEKNIKGAEAGTALRNVLSRMDIAKALPKEALNNFKRLGVDLDIITDKTLPVNTRLKEFSKIAGDSTALTKVFGLENKVAGQIILENVDKVAKYTDAVRQTGIAQEQSDKNTNTLTMRFQQLSNAWTNLFTSSTKVTGVMGVLKDIIVFTTENLETIIAVVGSAVAIFMAVKAAISAVVVVTKLWGAAQTVLNVIMSLNPIGLIIIAVAALIGVVILIIAKWDEWGSTIMMFFPLLSLFINHWDSIKQALIVVGAVFVALFRIIKDQVIKAFQNLVSFFTPLVNALVTVGKTISEALFDPFKEGKGLVDSVIDFMIDKIISFLDILAKIPGVSDAIKDIKDALGEGSDSVSTGVKTVSKLPEVATDPLARSPLSTLPTSAAKEDSLSGSGTTIKSAAPKTFNLTIGSLVEGGITVTASNVTEGAEEIKEIFTQMLLGSLNDTQENIA